MTNKFFKNISVEYDEKRYFLVIEESPDIEAPPDIVPPGLRKVPKKEVHATIWNNTVYVYKYTYMSYKA